MSRTVYVIPNYPHAWWRRSWIKPGVLVTAWDDRNAIGEKGIWRVTDVWADGAELTLVKKPRFDEFCMRFA